MEKKLTLVMTILAITLVVLTCFGTVFLLGVFAFVAATTSGTLGGAIVSTVLVVVSCYGICKTLIEGITDCLED